MNYRFIGLTARFYPDVRDSAGRSLMAVNGSVFDFEGLPPSDGFWVPAEDEPSEAGPIEVGFLVPAPEPVAPAPEPAPAVVEAPEPEPVPAPEPEPPAPAPAQWFFPGFAPVTQPYTR